MVICAIVSALFARDNEAELSFTFGFLTLFLLGTVIAGYIDQK